VQREPVQLQALRLHEPSPGENRGYVEGEPPERRDNNDAERGCDDYSRIELEPGAKTAWRLHTDVNGWPRWNADITAANLEGTPGGVRVITNESFAGAPVEADKEGMQAALDGSLGAWLAHLKSAAEAS
jgi:hypothetical protein